LQIDRALMSFAQRFIVQCSAQSLAATRRWWQGNAAVAPVDVAAVAGPVETGVLVWVRRTLLGPGRHRHCGSAGGRHQRQLADLSTC
jgi:hypothetical protein